VKTWVESYEIDVETFNVYESDDWKILYGEDTEIVFSRHLFCKVFLDGRAIEPHPGNPVFKGNIIKALEETR